MAAVEMLLLEPRQPAASLIYILLALLPTT